MPATTDLRVQIAQALQKVGGAASSSAKAGGAACPSLKVAGAASPRSSQPPGQAGPATVTFKDAALHFLTTLGYQSDRTLPIATPQQFLGQLDPHGRLTERERTALDRCTALHLLFQLTDSELKKQGIEIEDDSKKLQTTKIESYLFFAAELPPGHYTRTALATLVRAINKPLPMPALVLFRHGESVSLGIIHRRLHKRDAARDVLEKVTLIKDIACAAPHRGHIEILHDLSFDVLRQRHELTTFVQLHEAWQKTLDTSTLTRAFYTEIANWFFWARDCRDVMLPKDAQTDEDRALFFIRLLRACRTFLGKIWGFLNIP
ncbi:MAG: hypothetical protein RMK20_12760, partial [Verrucomicrobiales bacterium]|nr:hypothetical protein [Verrucomicrobiales bacterium]